MTSDRLDSEMPSIHQESEMNFSDNDMPYYGEQYKNVQHSVSIRGNPEPKRATIVQLP